MKNLKFKNFLFVLFTVLTIIACANSIFAISNEEKRKGMVINQIMDRGVKDKKVLEAMLKVPRHEFVPKGLEILAYTDKPLPIGSGQTISQPYIVALMTELLKLEKGKGRVLEIGTGSGYQAAILAEIVREVYTIEIIPELAVSSKKLLFEMGYKNILVKQGDGYYGWPEYAPFDGIIVTCGATHVPPALVEQLKVGGRMVIPVGKGYQKLLVVTKESDGKINTRFVADVIFVPLLGGHEDE